MTHPENLRATPAQLLPRTHRTRPLSCAVQSSQTISMTVEIWVLTPADQMCIRSSSSIMLRGAKSRFGRTLRNSGWTAWPRSSGAVRLPLPCHHPELPHRRKQHRASQKGRKELRRHRRLQRGSFVLFGRLVGAGLRQSSPVGRLFASDTAFSPVMYLFTWQFQRRPFQVLSESASCS